MRQHPKEVEDAVARLWADGVSTTQIGKHVGIAKGTVVSMAKRLGLPARETPIGQRKKAQRGAFNAAKAAASKSRKASPWDRRKSSGRAIGKGMADAVWRPKTCQYIAGEPSDPKCGAKVTPGSPYCAQHHAITHQGWQAKDQLKEAANAFKRA